MPEPQRKLKVWSKGLAWMKKELSSLPPWNPLRHGREKPMANDSYDFVYSAYGIPPGWTSATAGTLSSPSYGTAAQQANMYNTHIRRDEPVKLVVNDEQLFEVTSLQSGKTGTDADSIYATATLIQQVSEDRQGPEAYQQLVVDIDPALMGTTYRVGAHLKLTLAPLTEKDFDTTKEFPPEKD